MRELAPRYGAQVVYAASASLAQPDFTAECLNAQAAGVDLLNVVLDGPSLSRVAAACARQGYTPTIAATATGLTDAARRDPNLEGMIIGSMTPPWTDTSIPAVAEMHQAFATHAPGATIQPASIVAWTAARLLEAATTELPEPATPADVIAGLDRIRDEDLGGLTYPLTFTAGQPAPRVMCWFEMRVEGGQFVAGINGNAQTCE